MDVAVSDGEVVKLLEPGQMRRVRAIERAVETSEGAVDGLEVWFGGQPEADRRTTDRGLREGEKVRITEGGLRAEIHGNIGTLLQFTVGTVGCSYEEARRGLGTALPHLHKVLSLLTRSFAKPWSR